MFDRKTPHNFWINFEHSHPSACGREGKVRGGYKYGSTFLFFVQRGFCPHPPHYNSAPCLVLLLSAPLLGCGGGSGGGSVRRCAPLGCMDISVAHPHTFAHPHLHDDVHKISAFFGLFRSKHTPKTPVKLQDFEIPWILTSNLILSA